MQVWFVCVSRGICTCRCVCNVYQCVTGFSINNNNNNKPRNSTSNVRTINQYCYYSFRIYYLVFFSFSFCCVCFTWITKWLDQLLTEKKRRRKETSFFASFLSCSVSFVSNDVSRKRKEKKIYIYIYGYVCVCMQCGC